MLVVFVLSLAFQSARDLLTHHSIINLEFSTLFQSSLLITDSIHPNQSFRTKLGFEAYSAAKAHQKVPRGPQLLETDQELLEDLKTDSSRGQLF
jgi:hypothetical protein